MPNIVPCRYCGSTCVLMDVTNVSISCSRCHRSVRESTQRKAARKWMEDPLKMKGLPWPALMCTRCQATPKLMRETADGDWLYCFQCPVCKASSQMCTTPYDAMLAWREDMVIRGDD